MVGWDSAIRGHAVQPLQGGTPNGSNTPLLGLAVVATDLPVYHRACADGAGLLAADEQEWYEALRALIMNKDLRSDTVSAARGRISAMYSRDALRRQLLSIVTEPSPKTGRLRSRKL